MHLPKLKDIFGYSFLKRKVVFSAIITEEGRVYADHSVFWKVFEIFVVRRDALEQEIDSHKHDNHNV